MDNISEFGIMGSHNLGDGELSLPFPDEGVLLDCPPRKIDLKDFSRAMGHSKEEVDDLGIDRYYASQLIGIKPSDEPNYEIFKKDLAAMGENEKQIMVDLGAKIMDLRGGEDVCDKVGVRFIGKLLNHYCPGDTNFGLLPKLSQDFIKSFFSYPFNDNKVINYAVKWANCDYKDYK
jgi:hypothetical protein